MKRSSSSSTSTVTIGDVADAAGCAISTASRVLNGSGPFSSATAELVRNAASRLGYVPNSAGRSLKTGASKVLGVLIPSITNPVFASSLSGIEAQARQAGFDLIVTTSDYRPERDCEAARTLLSRGVEGVVLTVTDPSESAAIDLLRQHGVACVTLYNEATATGEPTVTVDNRGATRDLTARILAHGHRRISFVAGRFGSSDRSRARYEGYCDALSAAGLVAEPAYEIPFLPEEEGLANAMRDLMSEPDAPTAIMCSNDLLAIACIACLREAGFSVPRDISVTGFDGIAVGQMFDPRLTTVAQPADEMGRRAVDTLLTVMGGEASPNVILPHEIRFGRSLAAAPKRNTGALRAAPAFTLPPLETKS